MKKIEAETLEGAYKNAAKELNCSVTEIDYEIVQYPATGMMGLFKKPAIIIAVRKVTADSESESEVPILNGETSITEVISEETISEDSFFEKENIIQEEERENTRLLKQELFSTEISQKEDKVLDSFFETDTASTESVLEKEAIKKPVIKEILQTQPKTEEEFFEHAFDDDRDSPKNRELSIEIENKLKKLFKAGCFEIDTVEVDVFNNTAHMFVDGEDAALLIGKEGYRYNALSYMLFNWINAQYDLYIKLEIAEFIQTQEEMIVNYLKPIIEHIEEKGRGKTKPLDGILVQIALEQLRATFPNKYVAIKTGKDGNKFIIINNFNNRKK